MSNVKTVKPAPKTKAAPATEKLVLTHVHRDAGGTGKNYTGASGYFNANRRTAVKLANYANRTPASLTARTIGALSELRSIHGAKTFNVRGIDNAIVAILAGVGFIKLSGGHTVTDSAGIKTLTDAPDKPLQATFTPAGKTFGKATA